jgi:hypothetical protein
VYKPLVKDRHGWAVPERMARACDAEAGLAFDECRQRAALARLVAGDALAAAGWFVSETGSSAKSS